ncbi:hypothetical protein [Streptomyces sp. NPDC008122]|uniref:hypothetical protein n=1 Tax=Streptomyces sp. NPDC008122 TaxID=3364810 RepID=UPI0036EECAF6
MDRYVVIAGALALLLGLSGAAALRAGWMPPWLRRHVARPALHGWGQLAMAAAFAVQVFGQVSDDLALRSDLDVATFLGLLGGTALLSLAQVPRRDR